MKKFAFSKAKYPTRLIDDSLKIGKIQAFDALKRLVGTERAEKMKFKKNKFQWIWVEE